MTTNNKQIVTTAYQRIFGDLDASAVDEYIGKDFIQHNPTTPDGPEGVIRLPPKPCCPAIDRSQGLRSQTAARMGTKGNSETTRRGHTIYRSLNVRFSRRFNRKLPGSLRPPTLPSAMCPISAVVAASRVS
jgi:hypothetical protein